MLKYKRTISSSRFVFVTDNFKENHTAIWNVMVEAASLVDSKWTFLDLDGFVYRKTGAYKHRAECLGLGCKSDVDNGPLVGLKHVCDGPAFLKIIAKLDFEKSSSGLR